MKHIFTTLILLTMVVAARAQSISLPPSGDNQKSKVSQWIGPVEVTITYNSPNVKGPGGEDRKGHIWGDLVHYGYIDQGFGPAKAAPWRAGANENTTIRFSHDVQVEGKPVKAGTYGLFLGVEKEGPWTLILSNNASSWGSYFYNEKEDALRAPVKPVDCEYTEYLTFGFDTRELKTATAYLQWENKRIPFRIDVPNVTELYLARIRDELRSSPGFNHENWMNAAQYCVREKTNLEEALKWADNAISLPFIGVENFNTLQTKASVLEALGRNAEAESLMSKAIVHKTATVSDIHQYGRGLLAQGKNEKAMEVFKLNAKNHPEDKFTPNVGLARGYAALGDKKNAIRYWELALKNIPEDQKGSLKFYEGELAKVKEGK
jgi:hypothetical protein